MNAHKRTALITGASSGIGAEFARLLAARGYNCILTARRTERLQKLAAELREQHQVDVDVITADLSTADGAQGLHQEVSALGKPVDFLVNNAGFGVYGKVVEQDLIKLQQMMQLNMVSLTVLTQLFAKEMVGRGRGHILQVASVGITSPFFTDSAWSFMTSFDL